MKKLFLSYIIKEDTPTYGNKNKFFIEKKSSIKNGDVANDSFIKTTVHIGTHLDMPYHFYDNGQTIDRYKPDFFIFKNILFVDIIPKDFIINEELINKLNKVKNKDKVEIIIVKTGICYKRNKEEFWKRNYGFAPLIANYLREYFPNVRVFGFDSISISSFTNRMLGREAHKSFLNPKKPILLLEDMDLREVNKNTIFKEIIILPLRISKCDGLSCTVIAEVTNG